VIYRSLPSRSAASGKCLLNSKSNVASPDDEGSGEESLGMNVIIIRMLESLPTQLPNH